MPQPSQLELVQIALWLIKFKSSLPLQFKLCGPWRKRLQIYPDLRDAQWLGPHPLSLPAQHHLGQSRILILQRHHLRESMGCQRHSPSETSGQEVRWKNGETGAGCWELGNHWSENSLKNSKKNLLTVTTATAVTVNYGNQNLGMKQAPSRSAWPKDCSRVCSSKK